MHNSVDPKITRTMNALNGQMPAGTKIKWHINISL